MESWWVFSLFRERSWKSSVKENIPYCQPWVTLGLGLESVKYCMMSACKTGRHACLKRGLALKPCFVLTYRVVLRLYECRGLYLERFFLISWNDDNPLVVLKQEIKNADSAGLCVHIVAVVLSAWGEKSVSFLLTFVWRSLISTSQFFFQFTVDITAEWDVLWFNSAI